MLSLSGDLVEVFGEHCVFRVGRIWEGFWNIRRKSESDVVYVVALECASGGVFFVNLGDEMLGRMVLIGCCDVVILLGVAFEVKRV